MFLHSYFILSSGCRRNLPLLRSHFWLFGGWCRIEHLVWVWLLELCKVLKCISSTLTLFFFCLSLGLLTINMLSCCSTGRHKLQQVHHPAQNEFVLDDDGLSYSTVTLCFLPYIVFGTPYQLQTCDSILSKFVMESSFSIDAALALKTLLLVIERLYVSYVCP